MFIYIMYNIYIMFIHHARQPIINTLTSDLDSWLCCK